MLWNNRAGDGARCLEDQWGELVANLIGRPTGDGNGDPDRRNGSPVNVEHRRGDVDVAAKELALRVGAAAATRLIDPILEDGGIDDRVRRVLNDGRRVDQSIGFRLVQS